MIINCFKTAQCTWLFRTISRVRDRAFCESSKRLKTANYISQKPASLTQCQGSKFTSNILNINRYQIFAVLIQVVKNVCNINTHIYIYIYIYIYIFSFIVFATYFVIHFSLLIDVMAVPNRQNVFVALYFGSFMIKFISSSLDFVENGPYTVLRYSALCDVFRFSLLCNILIQKECRGLFRTQSNIQGGVFCQIVNHFQSLTIFAKRPVLDL